MQNRYSSPDRLQIEIEETTDYTYRVKVFVGDKRIAYTAESPTGRAAQELGAILWELTMSQEPTDIPPPPLPRPGQYPGGMVAGVPAFNKQNTDYVEQANARPKTYRSDSLARNVTIPEE